MGLLVDKKNAEFKKHIATIHCSNTLSLLQRKISNALLFHAYEELLTQEEHEITIKQLCNLIGYKGNNHAAIKEALKGLIITLIEWNLVDDEIPEEDWNVSTMLASARIKGPLCIYAYSPRLKALLHSPSIYGKINLAIQAKFKSSYGLALYENCARYQRLIYTSWFTLDIFRRLMGVPKEQYLIFRDFKKRVLDKSVEEVNTYSDLQIEPEIERKGREVNRIRFHIQSKLKDEDSLIAREAIPLNEYVCLPNSQLALKQQLMKEIKLNEMQVKEILNQYPVDYIEAKLQLVKNSASFKKRKINNLAGYLVEALRKDYQDTGHSQEQAQLTLELPKKLEQNHQDKYAKAYQQYQDIELMNFFEQLPIAQQHQLIAEFETHYFYEKRLDVVYGNMYQLSGLQSPTIRGFFRNFLKEQQSDLVLRLLPFEEFLKTHENNNNNN